MWGSPPRRQLQEGSRVTPGLPCRGDLPPWSLPQQQSWTSPLPFSVPHPRNEDYCLPHRGAGSPPRARQQGTAVSLLRAPRLAPLEVIPPILGSARLAG